jgi:uncharacterized membrane protein
MGTVLLFASAFLASAVEFVEAATIVLAVGLVRGWRAPLLGIAAATVALGVVVAALGPALTAVPIGVLRLVVGWLLLAFGLQWLRKAILRASGYVALHDELAIFREEEEAARAASADTRAGLDWYGFTLSFKGVFLEGLEVAFIVITFGAAQGRVGLAALAAAAALVLVTVAAVLARAPLARVPENALKLAVGLALTTYGCFWAGEGAGVDWPGGDLALLALLAFFALASLGLARVLRRQRAAALRPGEAQA